MRNDKSSHTRSARTGLSSAACIALLIATFLTGLPASVSAQAVSVKNAGAATKTTFTTELEEALLATGDSRATLKKTWEPVVVLLTNVTLTTKDPVLRLLKGHACLATNRNNKALSFFLSTRSRTELQEWRSWSDEFASKHSDNAITHYFKGDASARLEQWDTALSKFTMALAIAPKHPLILNARGVSYAFKQQWNEADKDLFLAVSKDPAFTDASANIGTKLIHKNDGAMGAITWFDYALQQSQKSEFALAHYLRACTKCVTGDIKGAKEDMQEATKGGDARSLFLNRRALEVVMRMQESEFALARVDGEEASMSIQRTMTMVTNNMDRMISAGDTGFNRRFLSPIVEAHKFGTPEVKQHVVAEMNRGLAANPGLNNDFSKGLGRYEGNMMTGRAILEGINVRINARADAMGALVGPGLAMGGKVGGSVGGDLWRGNGLANLTNRRIEAVQELRSSLNLDHKADGFKTGVQGAAWDKGDWPFDPIYGLLYGDSLKNDKSQKGAEE